MLPLWDAQKIARRLRLRLLRKKDTEKIRLFLQDEEASADFLEALETYAQIEDPAEAKEELYAWLRTHPFWGQEHPHHALSPVERLWELLELALDEAIRRSSLQKGGPLPKLKKDPAIPRTQRLIAESPPPSRTNIPPVPRSPSRTNISPVPRSPSRTNISPVPQAPPSRTDATRSPVPRSPSRTNISPVPRSPSRTNISPVPRSPSRTNISPVPRSPSRTNIPPVPPQRRPSSAQTPNASETTKGWLQTTRLIMLGLLSTSPLHKWIEPPLFNSYLQDRLPLFIRGNRLHLEPLRDLLLKIPKADKHNVDSYLLKLAQQQLPWPLHLPPALQHRRPPQPQEHTWGDWEQLPLSTRIEYTLLLLLGCLSVSPLAKWIDFQQVAIQFHQQLPNCIHNETLDLQLIQQLLLEYPQTPSALLQEYLEQIEQQELPWQIQNTFAVDYHEEEVLSPSKLSLSSVHEPAQEALTLHQSFQSDPRPRPTPRKTRPPRSLTPPRSGRLTPPSKSQLSPSILTEDQSPPTPLATRSPQPKVTRAPQPKLSSAIFPDIIPPTDPTSIFPEADQLEAGQREADQIQKTPPPPSVPRIQTSPEATFRHHSQDKHSLLTSDKSDVPEEQPHLVDIHSLLEPPPTQTVETFAYADDQDLQDYIKQIEYLDDLDKAVEAVNQAIDASMAEDKSHTTGSNPTLSTTAPPPATPTSTPTSPPIFDESEELETAETTYPSTQELASSFSHYPETPLQPKQQSIPSIAMDATGDLSELLRAVEQHTREEEAQRQSRTTETNSYTPQKQAPTPGIRPIRRGEQPPTPPPRSTHIFYDSEYNEENFDEQVDSFDDFDDAFAPPGYSAPQTAQPPTPQPHEGRRPTASYEATSRVYKKSPDPGKTLQDYPASSDLHESPALDPARQTLSDFPSYQDTSQEELDEILEEPSWMEPEHPLNQTAETPITPDIEKLTTQPISTKTPLAKAYAQALQEESSFAIEEESAFAIEEEDDPLKDSLSIHPSDQEDFTLEEPLEHFFPDGENPFLQNNEDPFFHDGETSNEILEASVQRQKAERQKATRRTGAFAQIPFNQAPVSIGGPSQTGPSPLRNPAIITLLIAILLAAIFGLWLFLQPKPKQNPPSPKPRSSIHQINPTHSHPQRKAQMNNPPPHNPVTHG